MDFVFHLGFNEELALLELESVLGTKATQISPRKYQVALENFSDLNTVSHRLGGLVEVRSKSSDKLVWRHQAKEWYKRDRLKPFADGKKGMLPPKVARIMVNLALGKSYKSSQVLLDPFCGSGTTCVAAKELDRNYIGIDIGKDYCEIAKNRIENPAGGL